MIIVRIIGGMGNQMFGYAMGKAFSCRNNTNLSVDLRWILERESTHNISLNSLGYFQLSNKVSYQNGHDLYQKLDNKIFAKIIKIIDIFTPYKFKYFIIENNFKFNFKFVNLRKKNLYIYQGYWQSYKYFIDFDHEIRKDFTFKPFVYEETKKYADVILNDPCSISVHVRRGDFENNQRVSKIHGGICTIEYYQQAMDFIKQKFGNPNFYVFSDDLDWVNEKFGQFENTTIVNTSENMDLNIGHNDYGYRDMYLMSICKHNIIANSSFSWWAAWLNSNQSKIVIAPKKWFNDSKDTSDLIPKEWLRI